MKRAVGHWTLPLTLLLALLLALPQPGTAQGRLWSVQSTRGWIGISFDYTSAVVDGSRQTVVVIGEVAEGSPAEEAGIRAGDTITHLDGQPISVEVMSSLTRSLEVGDLVRMTILRGNRPREVLVEAGPQGQGNWVMAPDAREMVIRLDSVRGAIIQNLDSLRVTIGGVDFIDVDSLRDVAIRIVPSAHAGGDPQGRFAFSYSLRKHPSDSLEVITEFAFPEDMALPFGAYVVASKETEPLREELRRLRREITEVRRSEVSRMRELQAGVQGPVEEVARKDERIRELKAREQALLQEQIRLSKELNRLSEETLQRQFFEVQLRQEEAMAQAFQRQQEGSERSRAQREELSRDRARALVQEYESQAPSTHIIVGQNFVAGAQITPLNPALAEYFGVERGVLVTEVLDGTPAAQAGILAGDVIVRVGTETVSSLDDLRFGVGFFERPLRLRVIRKGEPVEITIRR